MPPVSLRSILPISAKARTEADRLEPVLVESLGSPLSMERKRMEGRVLSAFEEEAGAIMAMLLRHMETRNDNAREAIDRLLNGLTASREGKAALLENLAHPDQEVRKGARTMLVRIWGEGMGAFATDYEQAMLLMNVARSRDIYVDDIMTLTELVKVTLLEGDRERALEDIALIVKLLRHRYRSVETMKDYLAEMLRITPELSKLGVMSGRIEESLRTASRANRTRTFDYTKELIDERMREVELIDRMRSIGATVKEALTEAPHMPLDDISGTDMRMFTHLKGLVEKGTTMSVTGRASEIVAMVSAFLADELFPYLEGKAQDRLSAMDPSLLYVIYTVGLTCLKLMAEPLPSVSEELYVTYFKELEGAPSLAAVPWPSAVL
ncbi:MAG TPA: hypothetical protein PKO24_01875 [Methanomassiliicoccales archaeon]|nr:hypothetical protein [Methanomassiliicoccales archaeon]HQM66784.1 hypothetical protein [Methanomassiliicoccales archaeon]